MYEELVKALRYCVLSNPCDGCPYYDPNGPAEKCATLNIAAADAIERLKCFNALWQEAAKIAHEREPKWIPVTERLPKGADKSGELCENVWLFFDDGNVYPGWMNGITEKVYYLDNYSGSLMEAPISRVKMWQPRPEPPKEET